MTPVLPVKVKQQGTAGQPGTASRDWEAEGSEAAGISC